jgi:hypothetical protein
LFTVTMKSCIKLQAEDKGPQTYRANESTPNKGSQTADRRWSFRLGLVAKVTTRHSKKKI